MKTSFYFVVWILIYPILGLFHNEFIYNHSFLVALGAVWGISWLLNQTMPYTLEYERISRLAPVMENIYTGDVAAILKRLTTETRIEFISSLYFIIATFVIAIAVFKVGDSDWFALLIFLFFSVLNIVRSLKLNKALNTIRHNPTPEQCAETVPDLYQTDYAAYYEARQQVPYDQMLPQRPAHFKAFQIFSIVMASVCALLGFINIILAALVILASQNVAMGAVSIMYLLYGSLATYFGIKDFVSTKREIKQQKMLAE